MTQTHYTYIF